MLKQEKVKIGEREFLHTYSDKKFYILQVETNTKYDVTDDVITENTHLYGKCSLNKSFFKKYGPFFISGFLLLYGARFAGGCTSGHMMSGMMQSSLSGYVFAGVVFLVAIPTAILTKKFRQE